MKVTSEFMNSCLVDFDYCLIVIEDVIQREALSGSATAVVASAISYSSIHPKLVSPRGSHVFTRIIEIKPPNQV